MINKTFCTIKSFEDLAEKFYLFKAKNFSEINESDYNAVFDLDNTLLIGDIGDAVFSMLKIMGYSLNLSWKEYLNILENDGKEVAYSKVVSSMAGLSVKTVEKATEEVLNSKKDFLEIEGTRVPIPKPNPIMLKFLNLLKGNKFNIFVISATNIFSVKLTCNYLFNIPKQNCYGIEPETIINNKGSLSDKVIITERIKDPLTISTGKEQLYWDKIGKTRPLITAGDSETDIYLLNLVDQKGLSIWVGNDIDRFINIRKKSTIPNKFICLLA